MGEMITKPDANPILFAICNLIGLGALGYYLMGQQKKAMISLGVVVVCYVLGCCTGLTFVVGSLFVICVTYDAYMLGQKLQSGESIGMNENGLDFLNSIFKD